MSRIAILGGTFNPFHIGHYEMLSALNEIEEIDKIIILPDKIPPHKTCDFLADDSDRIKMCSLVAEDFEKATVSTLEFERKGKSYTYDTVKILKEKYPSDEFFFCIGGDMLVYFDKWYKYEELIKEISFIAFRRSDTDNSDFNNCIKKFIEMGMKVKVMENEISAVSSTEIRNDFKKAKNLVPKKIYEFLTQKGIYNDR